MDDDLLALTHRPGPGPHLTSVSVNGRDVTTLADLPPARDRLLFVGPEPVAGECRDRSLPPGPAGADLLAAADHSRPPSPRNRARDRRRCPHGRRARHHRSPEGPNGARRSHRCRADRGRRTAVAEDRDLAARRDRVHLQASGAPSRRVVRSRSATGDFRDVALAGRPCVLMPGPYAPAEQVAEGLNFLRNLVSALPTDRP